MGKIWKQENTVMLENDKMKINKKELWKRENKEDNEKWKTNETEMKCKIRIVKN